MKIYRLYLDSYRCSYTGYWSSIDKIIESLPNCEKFKECVRCRMPSYRTEGDKVFSPDYNHNKNLKARLVMNKEFDYSVGERWDGCEIWLDNFKTVVSDKVISPEVKEPGKPYIPSAVSYINRTDKYESVYVGSIGIKVIELDNVEQSHEN